MTKIEKELRRLKKQNDLLFETVMELDSKPPTKAIATHFLALLLGGLLVWVI